MKGPRVGVVDYGAGNILNVLRALQHLGTSPQLVDSPEVLGNLDGIVIPGVGAFGAGMQGLRESGMDTAVRTRVDKGTPVLAICLGMQLLAESSEESPGVPGLGIVDGHVRNLRALDSAGTPSRVPDTGWASVVFSRNSLGFSAERQESFYFSHSYYLVPSDDSLISGFKLRGSIRIPVFLEKENVIAAQFHPEKSGPVGVALIDSWITTKLSK